MTEKSFDIMQENIRNIGASMKRRRKEKGLTLRDLAQHTGLSISYLSKIERDATSPMLSSLDSICAALDTTVADLLRSEVWCKRKIVVRRSEMRHREYPQYLQSSDSIEFNDGRISGLILTIYPGKPKESMTWRHAFAELCTVLQGTLLLTLNGVEYRLEAGDSAVIEAKKQHRTQNGGAEDCITYWVRCREHP